MAGPPQHLSLEQRARVALAMLDPRTREAVVRHAAESLGLHVSEAPGWTDPRKGLPPTDGPRVMHFG